MYKLRSAHFAFALAFALAPAFACSSLFVILEGNLLLPLPTNSSPILLSDYLSIQQPEFIALR